MLPDLYCISIRLEKSKSIISKENTNEDGFIPYPPPVASCLNFVSITISTKLIITPMSIHLIL